MSMRQPTIKPARHNQEPASPPPASSLQRDASPAGRIASERLLHLPELIRTIDSGRLPLPVKPSTRCIAERASEIGTWAVGLRAA